MGGAWVDIQRTVITWMGGDNCIFLTRLHHNRSWLRTPLGCKENPTEHTQEDEQGYAHSNKHPYCTKRDSQD